MFNTLNESATKTEAWISKNQSTILIAVGVIVVGIFGVLLYNQMFKEPAEAQAAAALYYPQQDFIEAFNNEAQKDSLLTLSLEGADGQLGFLDIINDHDGTDAANLARYSAGVAYLNLKKYKEAATYLEGFTSDDKVLGAVALGALGDSYSYLNEPETALAYYKRQKKIQTPTQRLTFYTKLV